jgi:hypothetical protein
MLFHVVATLILKPFISIPEANRVQSFISSDSQPQKLYAASIHQLRDLMIRYCIQYHAALSTSFFNTALFTICLASLEDPEDSLSRL